MGKRLVIAIDGPAGAGKSTVARMLAERLGFCYIESGAMYRALALLARETGTNPDDGAALASLAAGAGMQFKWRDSQNRLLLNGRDVTEAIRRPEITEASSRISVHAGVRSELVRRQRELGRDGGVVMEGRDIGTQVFPDADLKIFLDASIEARSHRRLLDLETGGRSGSAEAQRDEIQRALEERDRRDREREHSPLVPAWNAVRIDSSGLTVEQVVEKILTMVKENERSRKPEARSQ